MDDKDEEKGDTNVNQVITEKEETKKGVNQKQHENESKHSSSDAEEMTPAEPLATTRSRRSNAGNRMGNLIQEERDEFYANMYGGFIDEEDDGDFDDEEGVNDDDSDSEGGSSSSDSDAEDEDEDEDEEVDEDYEHCDDINDDGLENNHRPQDEDVKPNVKRHSRIIPGSPSKLAYEACVKMCCICLGEQSDEHDEIIECDSCGVSVHESCYGVSGDENNDVDEDVSVHSNISSESTEPWFCEPCRRSVKNPYCELCPNTGGIFKQTDTGRWVHMVCALYTRGVTFENINNLSEVSLFELNHALYGSKACTICEDRRLARSGICIGCDAGLCKIFFHPTCAQKEGLLFESHVDEVDPYFAHCKQHADKSTIKKKKRICTALFARLNRYQPSQANSERIKKKLADITRQPDPHLTRWSPDNRPPIATKVNRMLMTSPSLIIRLTKKSELLGLDPKSSFFTVQDEMEMARQKWHIPPAFNLEFVAYCRDRATRMVQMKKHNVELTKQNITLKNEEASLREKYNSIKEIVSKIQQENEAMIKEARALQKIVTVATGKQMNLPLQMEQLIARCSNAKTKGNLKCSKNNPTTKTSTTYGCGKCGTVKDQHLLSLCDTCNSHIHIYCLDPPLSRVPKKTKFGGWQCSDCSERDEEEQEEALEEQNTLAIQEVDGPRRLRERVKYPDKYCHESLMLADFWSTSKRRSKKSRSSSKKKKVKVEPGN